MLLDQRTLRREWLYTARRDDEGAFLPWTSPPLAFDRGHPIVQAAFGGHPSYPNRCGEKHRTEHGGGVLSDWVVCGSNGSAKGGGVCDRGPSAAENTALRGSLGALLAKLFAQ